MDSLTVKDFLHFGTNYGHRLLLSKVGLGQAQQVRLLVLTARLDANWMVMDIHRQKYFGLFGRRCLSFRLAILRTLEPSFISQSLLLGAPRRCGCRRRPSIRRLTSSGDRGFLSWSAPATDRPWFDRLQALKPEETQTSLNHKKRKYGSNGEESQRDSL